MKIHTFFSPNYAWGKDALADNLKTLDLWKKSWSSWGWEPVVTSLDDAILHEKFSSLDAATREYPTAHPGSWTRLNILRWLAMPVVGGGWTCDLDVMNYGFVPEAAESAVAGSVTGCVSAGPDFSRNMAMHRSAKDYEKLIDLLLCARANQAEEYLGKEHLSDMVILRSLDPEGVKFLDIEKWVQTPGWDVSLLVHFCSGMCPQVGLWRSEYIQVARKGWYRA